MSRGAGGGGRPGSTALMVAGTEHQAADLPPAASGWWRGPACRYRYR
jgi:hypothetical protein